MLSPWSNAVPALRQHCPDLYLLFIHSTAARCGSGKRARRGLEFPVDVWISHHMACHPPVERQHVNTTTLTRCVRHPLHASPISLVERRTICGHRANKDDDYFVWIGIFNYSRNKEPCATEWSGASDVYFVLPTGIQFGKCWWSSERNLGGLLVTGGSTDTNFYKWRRAVENDFNFERKQT